MRRREADRAAGQSFRRHRGIAGSPGSCCAGCSCCRGSGHELEIGGQPFFSSSSTSAKCTEPAGDGAGRQRFAFQSGDDADHVHDFATIGGAGAMRVTSNCVSSSPKASKRQAALFVATFRYASEIGTPKTYGFVMTRKATGWTGASMPGERTGLCTPFWPPLRDECREVGEVAKFGFVDARLCADGCRLAYLSDDDADLARRHLHPGMLGNGVNRGRT